MVIDLVQEHSCTNCNVNVNNCDLSTLEKPYVLQLPSPRCSWSTFQKQNFLMPVDMKRKEGNGLCNLGYQKMTKKQTTAITATPTRKPFPKNKDHK